MSEKKKAGKAKEYNKNIELIAQLIINNRKALSEERTKHHNPATIKDKIASATGVSRKTIERCIKIIDQIDSGDTDYMASKLKERYYAGIGKSAIEEIFTEIDKAKKRK